MGSGLYRSDDRGDTWTATGDDLPSGADNTIESIVFSPEFVVDRRVYVVSLYDGVFQSTDGGWRAVTTTERMPSLIGGNTELGGGKSKKGKGFWKPNSGPGPN